MCKIRELDWLNTRLYTQLETSDIESLLYFSLIWNLFEKELFNNRFEVRRINNIIKEKGCLKNLNETKNMIEFFKKRYYASEELNDMFNTLGVSNSYLNLVKSVINGDTEDDDSKFKVVLIIIARFRNNLFHGIKVSGKTEVY